MAKLGAPRHRYAVAIICWLYVIFFLFFVAYCIFYEFTGSTFVIALINIAIASLGLLALYKEHDTLMKSFGIIQIILIVLQVLELIAVLIVALYKEKLLDLGLKMMMDSYYESSEAKDAMNTVQEELECCGRQSYNDWAQQTPYSCCIDSDCSGFYPEGCVSSLGSITSYILLAIGLMYVVGLIIHVIAALSAFALSRVYRQERFRPYYQPTIKHGF